MRGGRGDGGNPGRCPRQPISPIGRIDHHGFVRELTPAVAFGAVTTCITASRRATRRFMISGGDGENTHHTHCVCVPCAAWQASAAAVVAA
eukprot:CAMPEP_0204347238 /NCGR_PEP_ID=MMETSP0469-20131031/27788_1 /ASSEMBLY_ACC=CAM_ASM_000384 /TAXON_ID=2969 /ORGANISM="Oxyrrhis marina" /LENGTH=90 /DNA_ID=CAMNT_0051333009 /DNA_START=310 /DNA_END=582 /DNA_ORIENTATION=-